MKDSISEHSSVRLDGYMIPDRGAVLIVIRVTVPFSDTL
jgi:hypothetical protein